jgi:2-dehydropantoate 2-reductase
VQEEAAVPEVAVIGAGAGAVAASAAEQAGADVVICARSPVAGPVVLELDGEERRIAAPVICDVDDARPVDWVLLATKAQQTPQAGPWLARLCRPGTVVLLSGAITRLGRRHSVPTPANQAMYALLGALAPAEGRG